jgi:DNA polymerase IV
MERRIGCLFVPDFEIILAKLHDPSLNGRPVGIVPTNSGRAALSAVSSEARGDGLCAGMTLMHALRLCPNLRVISRDIRRLHLGQSLLQQSVQQFSPIYEAADYGEIYIDLTGTGRLFGDSTSSAARLRREILNRHRIAGNLGIASNKLVSRVCTAETVDVLSVAPGCEEEFLAPLPVISLPRLDRFLAPKTAEILTTLDELCLKALGQLAAVSIDHLELVLGSKARLFRQWAMGIDPTPVWPDSFGPVRQLCQTLDIAENDDDAILGILYSLVERLSVNLRKQKFCAGEVTLTLQYSDGYEIKKRQRLSEATDLEAEIFSVVQMLFLSISRRICVRQIGLTLPTIDRRAQQLSLFAAPEVRSGKNLGDAITAIRNRHGEQSIRLGIVQSAQRV